MVLGGHVLSLHNIPLKSRDVSVEFDKNFEHPRLPKSQRTYHFASDYISKGLQSF